MGKSTADDVGDGLDDETFERVAEERRPTSIDMTEGAKRDRGDAERDREPADPDGHRPNPPARLDDPRVPLVPETTVDPGESEAQSAARLGEGRSQDAWGEPEDAPDHADNETYEQQRAPRER